MAQAKSVQLVPAGARQVAPGIFQMRGRRSGVTHHKKHGEHHKRGPRPLMSQSFVRYVRQLEAFRKVATQFQAPAWLDVAALLLYMQGQAKHDKGAINVAKTMLLDRAAQMNPQIAQMIQSGAGDLGMLGLLGGFGFGGSTPYPNAGPRGQFQTMPAPAPTPGAPVETSATADEINALARLAANV